jgi:hypothetical protein
MQPDYFKGELAPGDATAKGLKIAEVRDNKKQRAAHTPTLLPPLRRDREVSEATFSGT